MHSRQQSRLDPSPFIVRTVIGFRHSIAGQPPKQAASCSVRSAIVVFPEIASFILIVMRMPRGYSFDRSSSGILAMPAAIRRAAFLPQSIPVRRGSGRSGEQRRADFA